MSLILIIGGGSTPPPPADWPLDPYTAGLSFAFARSRLLTSYTGPAYRVRRDSDNTEADITLDSDGSDVAALTAFVGSGSAYLSKWYDQSGGALDMAQATTTKQPLVVDRGFIMRNFQPDMVDDYIHTTAMAPAYSGGFTSYQAGQPAPVSGSPTPIIYQVGGTKAQILSYNSTDSQLQPLVGGGSAVLAADDGRRDAARSWATDLTQSTFATQNALRTGLASETLTVTSGTADGAPLDSGYVTMAAGPLGTSNFSSARLRVLAGYSVAHNAATADGISAAITPVPTADTGPLKHVLDALWIACGLVQLTSAYTGPLIRVRRDSDNTESDIGQSSGALDTAALATFVGSGNGFVRTWYDQSGRGNNVTQATAAKQPIIVSSGSYLGSVQFDGVDDIAFYPTPACQAISFGARYNFRTNTGGTYQPIINSTVNGSAGQLSYYLQFANADANLYRYIFNGGSNYYYRGNNQTIGTSQVNVFCMMGDPGTVDARYVDGVIAGDSSGGAGSIASASFFASTASIGGSEVNSGWAAVSFTNFVVWGCNQQGVADLVTAAL